MIPYVCDLELMVNMVLYGLRTKKYFLSKFFFLQIILPTGTFVKAEFKEFDGIKFFLDIDIYPTVADFGQTSGLCGFLDNDRKNDLRHKNGTEDDRRSYPYDEFTLSWQ
mgnify:CR=1 FL=1